MQLGAVLCRHAPNRLSQQLPSNILQKIQRRTECLIMSFPRLMLKASRGPICLTFFPYLATRFYWHFSLVTVHSQKLHFIDNTFRLGMQANLKSALTEI